MHPRYISIKDFTYTLPEEKIARYPLLERDTSRMLIYDGNISENQYKNITSYIPAGSMMVFNNTKVIEARILFEKPSGGKIELFCLEPANADSSLEEAMLQKNKCHWLCLIGGAKKWKNGSLEKTVIIEHKSVVLSAIKKEIFDDCFLVEFSWGNANISFAALLHAAGVIPLPPYLHRQAEEQDSISYQTVYADKAGSVAAPTAGLHFTDTILNKIKSAGIYQSFITLHVGAGTFKPVKAATMEGHTMHAEWMDISVECIKKIQQHSGAIVGVGTTVCRSLETIYNVGCKIFTLVSMGMELKSISISDIGIKQWDVYEEIEPTISKNLALESLLEWCKANNKNRLIIPTSILIAPGYQFKIIDALVTNFHQPESTLLLLVAALIGPGWRKVYEYALQHDFRFLSYGDGSLLWKQNIQQ